MKKKGKNLINSPMYLDAIRMVWKTKMRFLAILLMTMLGSAVFIGLCSLAPNMRKAMDRPIDGLHRENIQISSIMGLRDEDYRLIEGLDNVEKCQYLYKGDFYLSGKKDRIIRLQSLTDELSDPYILEGKLPESIDQILMDQKAKEELGLKVGDKINIRADGLEPIDERTGQGGTSENTTEETAAGKNSDEVGSNDSGEVGGKNSEDKDVDFDKPESPIEKDRMKKETFTISGFCDHVYYLYMKDRGRSLIGDGDVDYFGLVNKEAFDKKRPEMALLTLKDLAGLETSDDLYKNKEKEDLAKLEKVFENRGKEVQDQYTKDVRKDLADGEKKLADARQELVDAKQKLDDARADLDQGWIDYDKGQADFKKKMADGQAKLDDAKVKLDDAKAELDKGQAEYDKGLDEYQEGQQKIADGEKKLNDAKAELDKGQAQIDEGRKEIEDAYAQAGELEKKKKELERAYSQIDQGFAQLDQAEAALPPNYKDLIAQGYATPELKAAAAEIESRRSELHSSRVKVIGGLQQIRDAEKKLKELDGAKIELDQNEKKIAQGRKDYEKSLAEWQEGRDALIPAKEKLDQAKADLDRGRDKYNEGLADYQKGLSDLEEGRKTGLAELADAKKKLDDGEADYQEGLAKYDKDKPKAEADIEKAEQDIKDAKKELDDMRLPAYKISGRYNDAHINIGMGNADNMEALTLIFPGVFYLIAMLTTVTTIKRMVDEERTAIGTLKALGVSGYRIANKYLFYAGFSSAIGTGLGIIFGFYLLMPVIFNAYTKMFNFIFKPAYILDPSAVLLAFLIGLGLSLISAFISVRSSIRQKAALLMRPPTPANGHRILMERITFIWKRLNFTAKVTMRNLTAKKSRMFMTLIGVLGSMSLIVMGFGVQNSVASLVEKQFKSLQNYDIELVYDPDAKKEDLDLLKKYIEDKAALKVNFYREQASFINKEGVAEDFSLIVMENPDQFNKLRRLRTRTGGLDTFPTEDRALLTETFVRALGKKKLDKVMVKNYLGLDHEIPAEGRLEQYVGHCMFMRPGLYEKSFGKLPENNAIYMQLKDGMDDQETVKDLRGMEAVRYASSNADSEADISDIIGAIGIVVYIIILISALLSFVVLYNLTNLNISERQRELATIKVLGFHDRELTQYIYRETLLLSIIGILLGIAGGKGLHYAICMALSPPGILIDPELSKMSYLLGAGVVFFFSLIVMFIVHLILKKVDMVEALKADE